jgi:8-oxo-dGTP diphosphatase
VETGEDLLDALRRELAEELRLDLDDATPPELLWIQDQMVTRPGPTPPPRKFHVIFRLRIAPDVRARLARVEWDELPDGGFEPGIIEWVNYRKVGHSLPVFPLIGSAVSALASPDAPTGNPYLPPITDKNYAWK